MKNEIKRRTPEGSYQHVYKRTVDGGVLFYRVADHLVYYTVESVVARRHNLPIQASCHMFTHTHDVVAAADPSQLIAFEHDLNSIFTREYNEETGRQGRLFEGPFGSAAMSSEKDKRSALVYVFNNPVEKRLVRRAIEDRWTFLAYYDNAFPFSAKPMLSQCRWALRDALKEVDMEFRCGRYLGYAMLRRLFEGLNDEERWQLTDYIIHRYFYLDVKGGSKLFGGLSGMVKTVDATKGREFGVKEEHDKWSDVPYREMCVAAGRAGLLKPGFPLWNLSASRIEEIGRTLQGKTGATDLQVAKFLHRPFGRATLNGCFFCEQ